MSKRRTSVENGSVGLKHAKLSAPASRCANVIRYLSAQQPGKAKSGHPGAPMGCALIAHVLYSEFIRMTHKYPDWPNRDRFVLSNGHACALQYTMLHLKQYLRIEDLKHFRQLNSRCPGHPENTHTPGVEVTTGPLGQGIANAVGLAIAAHNAAEKFGDNLFNNYIYCLCGDGCLQEGVSGEASSLAGHLGLSKLILLYDANGITIDGKTNLSFTEDVAARYKAYGWNVEEVSDGDTDAESVRASIQRAQNQQQKPSIIIINTTIGYGDVLAGSEKVHGAPLADLERLKKTYGDLDDVESFTVPTDVAQIYQNREDEVQKIVETWRLAAKQFVEEGTPLSKEFSRRFESYQLPSIKLPAYNPKDQAESTRVLSGVCLNVLSQSLPELIGGSADLTGSNSSGLKQEPDFQRDTKLNRYIRFGVREHGMSGIANGICAFGGYRPFVATFMNFITYAWGAVRLSALSNFPVLYIATHDSIELGEDGPTHQPIEVFALLRATPNLTFIRPADGNEVSGAYRAYLNNRTGPTVLGLCRSGVPQLPGTSEEMTLKGAYVLENSDGTLEKKSGKKVVLAASGSEVHLIVEAGKVLQDSPHNYDVKLVSVPSLDLFEQQPKAYRDSVLPLHPRTHCSVYVEAASSYGWDRYFNTHVGMSSFGASAPKQALYQHFNFTVTNIVEKVLAFKEA